MPRRPPRRRAARGAAADAAGRRASRWPSRWPSRMLAGLVIGSTLAAAGGAVDPAPWTDLRFPALAVFGEDAAHRQATIAVYREAHCQAAGHVARYSGHVDAAGLARRHATAPAVLEAALRQGVPRAVIGDPAALWRRDLLLVKPFTVCGWANRNMPFDHPTALDRRPWVAPELLPLSALRRPRTLRGPMDLPMRDRRGPWLHSPAQVAAAMRYHLARMGSREEIENYATDAYEQHRRFGGLLDNPAPIPPMVEQTWPPGWSPPSSDHVMLVNQKPFAHRVHKVPAYRAPPVVVHAGEELPEGHPERAGPSMRPHQAVIVPAESGTHGREHESHDQDTGGRNSDGQDAAAGLRDPHDAGPGRGPNMGSMRLDIPSWVDQIQGSDTVGGQPRHGQQPRTTRDGRTGPDRTGHRHRP
ncbi:hypothetical protein CXG81DRAFT_16794 [Caulochytrium protostelioides]|uniref:Uncharacterized protein n=1 Tax=Caulochytrium protostelioides TaxID=1555241 RepID=A0A4P9XDU2_9FUNG|nr:hypothetical protein CXG81DRAFT_16794 [Caulochytrium protostelioides]|eukprot:RKP03694.1 hypothetical protein CXG81DRAFT_16794 [Caulochytrium protostelioides]